MSAPPLNHLRGRDHGQNVCARGKATHLEVLHANLALDGADCIAVLLRKQGHLRRDTHPTQSVCEVACAQTQCYQWTQFLNRNIMLRRLWHGGNGTTVPEAPQSRRAHSLTVRVWYLSGDCSLLSGCVGLRTSKIWTWRSAQPTTRYSSLMSMQ